jgi:drug/metabolite transporter (DMT)-like permease
LEAKIGKRTFSKNLYFLILLSSCLFCLWTTISIWGTVHTIQSHSYALSNLHSILIIPVLIIINKHVHKLEKYGSLLILTASVGIIFDKWSHRNDDIINNKKTIKFISNVKSDLYLLLSNIPACLYFALNRSIMRYGILKHLIIQNILIAFIFSISAILIEDATMDINLNHGIFGWLNS